MAEFHIWLQYIFKQHMGAENTFLLRIFDQCAAKSRIFLTRHKVNRGGGGQMDFMPTPRFGPNGAFEYGTKFLLIKDRINKRKKSTCNEIKQPRWVL